MKTLIIGAVIATALVADASAASVTINLPDIGNYAGFNDNNTGDTFTGSGFLGIYPNLPNDFGPTGPSFAHLFGLENYNGIYSETELQASLAGLGGVTINSASLKFSLNNGSGGNESVKVTSFTTSGALGFNASAPDNLGSVTALGITSGASSIDVTSLVSAAALANQSWLGLFLEPQGPGRNFLWTYSSFGNNEPGAELVIDYTSNRTVPEASSTAVLLGIGFSLLSLGARRFKPITA